MKIILNNKPEELPGRETISVSELLAMKNYTFKLLVVRVNNRPVPREEFETTLIRDGDNVMILHLISGG